MDNQLVCAIKSEINKTALKNNMDDNLSRSLK